MTTEPRQSTENVRPSRLAFVIHEAICEGTHYSVGKALCTRAATAVFASDWLDGVIEDAQRGVYHDFLPVAGHPDDDECTHRSDGTDGTYCGLMEAEHDRRLRDDTRTEGDE